jgi:hypothetical protein
MMHVDDNFISRHTEFDAHIEPLALVMEFVRHVNNDPTRNEVRENRCELFNLASEVGMSRIVLCMGTCIVFLPLLSAWLPPACCSQVARR